MKILGLDISSSTIGWSVIYVDGSAVSLLEYGHIKPPSKKKSNDNFSLRLDFAFRSMQDLVLKTRPDIVAIEDYAKKFTKGRSSAHTILTLASFNEVCGLATYQLLKKKPERIPVSRLRSLVKQEYQEDISDKEDVLKFCQKYFSNFKPTLNKLKNIKKESYDEADAIISALGYHLEIKNACKNNNI
jgi:Holliday junction resolvasome RuvABC endonuclease subunit